MLDAYSPSDKPEPELSQPTAWETLATSFSKFELKVRERRIATCLQAARNAIAEGRLSDATEALNEVAGLDPTHLELATLRKQASAAARCPSRGWSWAAAVVTVAVVAVLGAAIAQRVKIRQSGSREAKPPRSVQTARVPQNAVQHPASKTVDIQIISQLIKPTRVVVFAPAEAPREIHDDRGRPIALNGSAVEQPLLTARPVEQSTNRTIDEASSDITQADSRGQRTSAVVPATAAIIPATAEESRGPVALADVRPASLAAEPPIRAVPMPIERGKLEIPAATPSAPTFRRAAGAAPDTSSSAAATADTATTHPPIADEREIRKTLQDYEGAYEHLNAKAARAVWPTVNERALTRAFESLESQRLVFDSCAVEIGGAVALARCRGSASYVRKVGSKDPQVEPRRWTFKLRNAGDGWKIESAEAAREVAMARD